MVLLLLLPAFLAFLGRFQLNWGWGGGQSLEMGPGSGGGGVGRLGKEQVLGTGGSFIWRQQVREKGASLVRFQMHAHFPVYRE